MHIHTAQHTVNSISITIPNKNLRHSQQFPYPTPSEQSQFRRVPPRRWQANNITQNGGTPITETVCHFREFRNERDE